MFNELFNPFADDEEDLTKEPPLGTATNQSGGVGFSASSLPGRQLPNWISLVTKD